MPYLQFELNFNVSDPDKIAFAARIKDHFAGIMDTGTDHIAVTLRCCGRHDLSFGRSSNPADGIAFVNADIRGRRTGEQKRRLSLAFIGELQQSFKVPQENVYVILSEHPGEHFHMHDRVLSDWSQGEDPLASVVADYP